jgi:hypothetical protein
MMLDDDDGVAVLAEGGKRFEIYEIYRPNVGVRMTMKGCKMMTMTIRMITIGN